MTNEEIYELAKLLRPISRQASSTIEALMREREEARNAALEEALELCTDYGFTKAEECRDAIRALKDKQP